jgi:hypothetical protein
LDRPKQNDDDNDDHNDNGDHNDNDDNNDHDNITYIKIALDVNNLLNYANYSPIIHLQPQHI